MEQKFCYYCMSAVSADGTCPVCGLTAGTYQPAPHHIPPGTILMNRYLFGRVLGEGGFGITYLACDLRLDLKVAIKEYFPTDKAIRHSASSLDITSYTSSAAGSYESNKRKFLSEARTMARMEKQSEVVGVRDFFEANNTAYIVMEYVDGTTFRDLVKQEGGKIPSKKLLQTIEPLFDALSAMHDAGLVHRDISPDNLMLEHGKVRLLDFGCARESATGTNTLTIALKHGYAPIEQYTNHGQGPWTDVYSLASTIYFCLTGKAPVRSTDRLLGDELLLPSKLGIDLSREQERALLRAMAIQPRRRYQSMEEFRAALYEESPEPPPPPPPPPPKPDPEPDPEPVPVTVNTTIRNTVELPKPSELKKRFPLLPLLGIVAAVVLVISVAIGWNSGSEDMLGTVPFLNEDTSAVSGQCGNGITWTLDLDTGEMVLEGSGVVFDFQNSGEVLEEAQLYTGNSAPPWIQYRDQIKHLTVGDGITEIGSWAFAYCENLSGVHLGHKLRVLHTSSFEHSGLTELQMPASMQYIYNNALSGTLLEEIILPTGLKWLGGTAFEDCPNLKEVTIPGAATQLDLINGKRCIFSGNDELVLKGTSNSLVEEYARIWDLSFEAAEKGLWEDSGICGDDLQWYIDVDSGLLKISGTGDMYDFNHSQIYPADPLPEAGKTFVPWGDYRNKIYSIILEDGVTSIGEHAFERIFNLEQVHWSNTLESIGMKAFMDTDLEVVYIPESVEKMGNEVFAWSDELRYVILPENLKVLPERVFKMCPKLECIYIGRDTILEYDGENTPFSKDYIHSDGTDERQISANLVVYGLRNSPAEKFCQKYDIPFAVGARGMAAEHEGQCGDNVYWFVSGDTLVLSGTGNTWTYRVPEYEQDALKKELKEGKAFTSAPEFDDQSIPVHHLVVLPGVTGLSDRLFEFMDLQTADLGTVETIGLGALSGNEFTNIELPQTLTLLRGWNFANCQLLETLTVPGSTDMELAILYNTPALREVTFGQVVNIHASDDGTLFNDYSTDDHEHYTPSSDLIFRVRQGSDAEKYAKQHSIQFQYYD